LWSHQLLYNALYGCSLSCWNKILFFALKSFISNLSPPSSYLDCCLNWTEEKQVTFWFEFIDLHQTEIVVASTVVPMPFMDVDSLDVTRSCFLHWNLSFLQICLLFTSLLIVQAILLLRWDLLFPN
jgi:hypothetical protein